MRLGRQTKKQARRNGLDRVSFSHARLHSGPPAQIQHTRDAQCVQRVENIRWLRPTDSKSAIDCRIFAPGPKDDSPRSITKSGEP